MVDDAVVVDVHDVEDVDGGVEVQEEHGRDVHQLDVDELHGVDGCHGEGGGLGGGVGEEG